MQYRAVPTKDYARRAPRKRRARFFVFAIFAALFLTGAATVYSLVRDLPNPSRVSERSIVESTKIYDRAGTIVLYEIHGDQRRTVIPFNQIPDSVKHAALAAEDINFYHHSGIDWRGIARAVVTDILRGSFSQGGSTITQQFVKNSLLGSEKTITRKIREQILSILLERNYSKDEILGFYLNQIPYGANAYGIATAADLYFNKEPADLTLGEAAALASLPKAPTYYSPYGSHKKELLQRKDWVLDRMADAGFAARQDADAAKREALVFATPREAIRAPHFVQFVRDYLNKKYGEDVVAKGGLKVTTTLDWTLQQQAEQIVREGAEANDKLVQASNAALVALDPRSGDILAMVGSRDYFAKPIPAGCSAGATCRFDPYVNIATAERQPGSAFKPFVYATAFKKGYTPETVLFDAATEFNPGCNPDGSPGPDVSNPKDCYHPQDYDGEFRGPVSMRQAIAQSLNVPAVKTLYLAGIDDSIKTAEAMGITTLTEPERYGLSLVLGGAEVSLLDITSAYGVFAAEGIRHPAAAVLKVETNKGVILEEKIDAAAAALDTEIARVISSILSDNDSRVPVFSPRSSLYFSDRKVAAKTGTTQDYRDAWTIGYTPSIVAGVWVGNSNNAPMNQRGLSVMVAGPLWHKFMASALASRPPEDFTPPEPSSAAKPVFRGQYRLGPFIKIDKISGKLATGSTPPELVAEIGSGNISSILAIVKKDDPTGDPPQNPSDDPQYHNWQAGIDQWLAGHPLAPPQAPTAYDDLHTNQKIPRISFVNPADGVASIGSLDTIAINVDAAFPLRELSLFIDDALVESKTAPLALRQFSFRLAPGLAPGEHAIKITAYDAVANRATAERTLTIGQ